MSAAQGTVKRVPNRWGEGQRLREEILHAASRLLEETGSPEGISLRAVAREAGVTAPAIYKHFKDKTELMWTLLDTVNATIAERMRAARQSAPAEDTWAGLRATVDAYCDFALDEPRRYELLFRVGPSLPSRPESVPHPMQPVLDAWREAVAPYLRETEEVRVTDDERLAKVLWSALHGQFGLWWNVSDITDASELVGARESLLLAVFGRQ
ncbi:TetR/AcrR family transcriptional regulator [Streptomyces lincolnensis]|uniref:TetR/AcrR family transcriptional regulator n=1 Tax=Streptomyces lincolnensis TaxID=1915 RepID=UPI001E3A406D|nr:TetR/AcrR family transcriptional regulator [Streptomyces lincolnensis]MCD7439720.1 TetR/AcrR family transcriptional regulator [Streptomyces lincolnensis]